MPRLPKPKPLRQNSERRDVGLIAIDGGLAAAPEPTAGWLQATKAEWAEFWGSPLVQATLPGTDTPMIRRLFGLRDERERMMRVVRRGRVVAGSKGQARPNPLYPQVASFDAEIRQLEDRIGLSPQARLRLGISLGEAVRSLADLNAELDADTDAAAEADVLLAFAEPDATLDGAAGRRLDGGQPRPRARRRTG